LTFIDYLQIQAAMTVESVLFMKLLSIWISWSR